MVHSRDQDNLSPRPNSPTSRSTEATALASPHGSGLCEASDFRDKLYNFYYEPIDTEIELAEKAANELIDVDDIEAVATLVRKMYSYDEHLYGIQNVRHNEAQCRDSMMKSDAILAAVCKEVVNEWARHSNAGAVADQISSLKTLLEQLPPRWYQYG
ncbi:hypothetical protein NPX13_g10091 [Xylaria arbuscula]|uniref:Uncharacterized protein n=1 Tax=Xylaria arbuscula TaxID=114810 RepID=A0A9W8N5H0_9PEZI|nr:hypothetical protein NPX13_g10091 [Xylaria arbuscula]